MEKPKLEFLVGGGDGNRTIDRNCNRNRNEKTQPQPSPMTSNISPTTSSKLEQLTMEISRKEAIQSTKRETCSTLVDNIQTYQSKIQQYQNAIKTYTEKIQGVRSEVRATQEELQVLDDELEELQKRRRRLWMSATAIADNGKRGDGNGRDDGDLLMETQYACNLTQTQFDSEFNVDEEEGGERDSGRPDIDMDVDVDANNVQRYKSSSGERGVGVSRSSSSSSPKKPLHKENSQGTSNRKRDYHRMVEREREVFHEDGYRDADEDLDLEDINREIDDHYADQEEELDDYPLEMEHHVKESMDKHKHKSNNDMAQDEEIEYVGETRGANTSTRGTGHKEYNNGRTQGRFHEAETPAGLVPSVSMTPPPPSRNSQHLPHGKDKNHHHQQQRTTLHHFFGGDPTPSHPKMSEIQDEVVHCVDSTNTNAGNEHNDYPYSDRYATTTSTSTNRTLSQSSASIFPPNIRQHFESNNSSHNNHNNSAQSNLNGYREGTFETNLRRPRFPQERNEEYLRRLSSDNFPWTAHMQHELNHTFQIQNFRNHQKEIINCTLLGDDVFVIMRTGGGKSLTYQLPALIEGRRSPMRKITLVVSPLLSLIKDQEEQMNAVMRGTATSFTSAQSKPEQTRRWNLLRDANSGICIVFVTPERVSKSNKLRNELEKLDRQGRLGRFVIDECHCCSNWGHDFRPDYTQLGLLKTHFPRIPLIAVTATASDRVREDCCRLLNIGTNYQFFRSNANRPNLRYTIRPKPLTAEKVVHEMADFIKEHHPDGAGIIYTFSRREANTVAAKLGDLGITARAYHSDVSDSAKDTIHRSWMRNRTQVVVATIAFGLGINKPDVRFVLHHSLSKSIEAYYQESGRAGRDGNQADCVLFYSPKDVSRTIGMIHGDHGEGPFWSMARYAQAHGDDSLCRRIILSVLGEPGCESLASVMSTGTSTTEEREVGKYAKDVVQLIQCSSKDMTMAQVITIWRSQGNDTPDFIKENPPSVVLTKDECERLIVALILENILCPKVVRIRNIPNSIVYIECKEKAYQLLTSPNPKVRVRFPVRVTSASSSSDKKKNSDSKKKSPKNVEDGWMSKKNSTKKGGSNTSQKRLSSGSSGKKSKRASSSDWKKQKVAETECEVIDIDDSDDEVIITAPTLTFARSSRTSSLGSTRRHSSSSRSRKFLDGSDVDSDFEFD